MYFMIIAIKFSEENGKASEFEVGRLRFNSFDIEKVLAQGAHLMGSEGKEYDLEDTSSSCTGIYFILIVVIVILFCV